MKSSTKYHQSIRDKAEQLIRHYQIPAETSRVDALNAVFQKIENQNHSKIIQFKSRSKSKFIIGLSAAASVIFALSLYFYLATYSITTNSVSVLSSRLPDNSRIVLQKNSEIKYKKYFWAREVNLSGSAYFEVEKGEKFQVITKLGKVEVLGTRFLVSEKSDSLKVHCYEGKVKASISNNSFILSPGTFMSGTQQNASKNSTKENIAFPDFALFSMQFTNEPVSKVFAEISNFYQVTIHIKQQKNRNFSGTIKTGNLNATLDIVCTSMQMQYRFLSDTEIEIYN